MVPSSNNGVNRKSPPLVNRKSPPFSRATPSSITAPEKRQQLSPERNNNSSTDKYQIRPGTYKKPCDDVDPEDPTRGDIIAMVEKDIAFSDVENRRLLMAFIKKICQAP